MKLIRILFVLSSIVVFFYSCKSIHHSYEQPKLKTENTYRGHNPTDSTSFSDMKWREVFTDPLLQNLIDAALVSNLELRIALANIENAQAYLLQQKGLALPDLALNGTVNQSRLANTISPATGFAAQQYSLFVSSSWEIDIWGKYKSAKKSAIADLWATESFMRAVQTKIVAQIASSYYSLLALDVKKAIALNTIASREKYTNTLEQLQQAGMVNNADVLQSKAAIHTAQIIALQLDKQIREIENFICLLMGDIAHEVTRGTLDSQQMQAEIETGVPALLLANRPDVYQSEMKVISALELANSARAYFYPTITLTGRSGFVSNEGSGLFDPTSFFANLTEGLLQPILNKNTNRARLRSKIALQKSAIAGYELSFLTAGKEVSDALYSVETAQKIVAIRVLQLSDLNQAMEQKEELLINGALNYTDVLIAQQSYLTAEIESTDAKLNVFLSKIELYRALGGGWK